MREYKKREQAYPSDLTDTQWEEIKPLFSGMREYKWAKRELMDAVLYFGAMPASRITSPIIKLKSLISKVEQGDLMVHFDGKYQDEVGQLGESFNNMVNQIHRLVDTIVLQQKQKRESDLASLQEQIKPHFLYNTFDTIHWMSKKYNASDIEQLIFALTKLYRIGLSRGSEIITLAKEIEHIESYLFIQGIRYVDILDYEINGIPEAENLHVQKLILQPIVENAIYHGIKNRETKGKVVVDVYIKDDTLYLDVTDDGPGMPPEMVDKLNQYLTDTEGGKLGYGLYNVNKRITLMHGDRYRLQIFSREGQGTTVRISYPLEFDREDDSIV